MSIPVGIFGTNLMPYGVYSNIIKPILEDLQYEFVSSINNTNIIRNRNTKMNAILKIKSSVNYFPISPQRTPNVERLQKHSNLHHDGLTKIYYYKIVNDCLIIIREYIYGEPISTYLQRNEEKLVDEEILLSILDQCMNIFKYLISASFPHNNIKPTNIFLSHKGNIVFTDFDCFSSEAISVHQDGNRGCIIDPNPNFNDDINKFRQIFYEFLIPKIYVNSYQLNNISSQQLSIKLSDYYSQKFLTFLTLSFTCRYFHELWREHYPFVVQRNINKDHLFIESKFIHHLTVRYPWIKGTDNIQGVIDALSRPEYMIIVDNISLVSLITEVLINKNQKIYISSYKMKHMTISFYELLIIALMMMTNTNHFEIRDCLIPICGTKLLVNIFKYLPNIQFDLTIGNNVFNDQIVKDFTSQFVYLTKLEALYLWKDQISNNGLKLISDNLHNLVNLKTFDFTDNSVDDEGISYFLSFHVNIFRLNIIFLSSCSIRDSITYFGDDYLNLTHLYLSCNCIEDSQLSLFCPKLQTFLNIEIIDLSYNFITSSSVHIISHTINKLNKIKIFCLDGNPVKNDIALQPSIMNINKEVKFINLMTQQPE